MMQYWPPLAGGLLIGLSAVMLLLLNGRIAGISGIVGRLVYGRQIAANAAFVAGLLAGPLIFAAASHWPVIAVGTPPLLLVIAGLLVGFGTRMGSGCTSGHGILGLARLSPRSIVATVIFLSFGILSATVMRVVGL
jgi:uncharacterized membrane protein YedE/YeeE